MQAIYEAILMIPDSPSEATKVLFRLSRKEPHFLVLLKDMALQLYQRFAPSTQKQMCQFQTRCKQILTLLNRFMMLELSEKEKDSCFFIEKYYEWVIEILINPSISLSSKRSLTPIFQKILQRIIFVPKRLIDLVDHLILNNTQGSSGIFIYLASLLQSGIRESIKLETIKQIHQYIFYVALSSYSSLTNFYKNNYMEVDPGELVPNSIFLQQLKENQFILESILKIAKIIRVLRDKGIFSDNISDIASLILLNGDLAKYLSLVLSIEKDLLNSTQQQNPYGLKLIIVTSLRPPEKNAINKLKSYSLAILTIILSLTDKSFNIANTDKLLMRQLHSLLDLVLNDLFICTQNHLLGELSIQLQLTELIASMFHLLSVIVQFNDLGHVFQSMTIMRICQLVFFYSQAEEQELRVYESNPEEHFHFNYFICSQRDEKDQMQSSLQSLQQFAIKNRLVQFMRQMNTKIVGFNNIILDICGDFITLQMKMRQGQSEQLISTFLDKYSLNKNHYQCFKLESVLFVSNIFLQICWDSLQEHKRMKLLLETVQVNRLNNIELLHLYTLLSINQRLFLSNENYRYHYYLIEKVYEISERQLSTLQAAYCFIQKLLRKCLNDNTKDNIVLAEKLLGQMVQHFAVAQTKYPFQLVLDTFQNYDIAKDIIDLGTINMALKYINQRISNLITKNQNHGQILSIILNTLFRLMEQAKTKIDQNKELPYPDFIADLQNYNRNICSIVSNQLLLFLSTIIKKDLHKEEEEEEQILYYSYRFFSIALFQQITLQNQIITEIMKLLFMSLQKYQSSSQKIKKTTFELLYSLINSCVFSFDEMSHRIILKWMKDTHYTSQIQLNRVCLILQQLYYFIQGNINQYKSSFLQFYSQIIQSLQKTFLQKLLNYHNYMQQLSEQCDPDIRKINELRIQFDPKVTVKTNPITIHRLYNTILLNPYFDVGIIYKISQLIKKYNYEKIPVYDLTVQVLALEALVRRSRNVSVVQCFRFTTELLAYNSKETDYKWKDAIQISIAQMPKFLRSPLVDIDPYESYCILVHHEILQPQKNNPNSIYVNQFDQIQVNILQYLKSDEYISNLVKKLTSTRQVNKKPRLIMRIKKKEQFQI